MLSDTYVLNDFWGLCILFSGISYPIPSLPGRVGPGTTDQAAGTHGLIPDATAPVPAVLNTVRAMT